MSLTFCGFFKNIHCQNSVNFCLNPSVKDPKCLQKKQQKCIITSRDTLTCEIHRSPIEKLLKQSFIDRLLRFFQEIYEYYPFHQRPAARMALDDCGINGKLKNCHAAGFLWSKRALGLTCALANRRAANERRGLGPILGRANTPMRVDPIKASHWFHL